MNVLAPLFNFNWDGDHFDLEKLGKIQLQQSMPDLSNFKSSLTDFDNDALRDVNYWLLFEQKPTDKLSEDEKINIFMLALWITQPTITQVRISFICKKNMYTVRRYLDRFQSNWQYEEVRIDNNVLRKVNEYTVSLVNIYLSRKRLYNSLLLILSGKFSISWQVAFICFSAAMEAILTYSDAPGITRRLAKAFACLSETVNSNRNSAYKRFMELYKIRSDIMHGRAMNYFDANINLKNLNNFELLLKKVWETILSSECFILELEKSDAERKSFFDKIENGYQPPIV